MTPEQERELDAWVKEGETLFSGVHRWSFLFWLGVWWADRPWRKR